LAQADRFGDRKDDDMKKVSRRRLLATSGAPDKHGDTLKLIVKSIVPRDEALLKALAPHWEWIAEDGTPNIVSIMAQQDFWADTFKMVERKVLQDRVVDTSIAKEAVQRLAAEKPFG
jgi:NitT/TauT family transport system substrate-binding protein